MRANVRFLVAATLFLFAIEGVGLAEPPCATEVTDAAIKKCKTQCNDGEHSACGYLGIIYSGTHYADNGGQLKNPGEAKTYQQKERDLSEQKCLSSEDRNTEVGLSCMVAGTYYLPSRGEWDPRYIDTDVERAIELLSKGCEQQRFANACFILARVYDAPRASDDPEAIGLRFGQKDLKVAQKYYTLTCKYSEPKRDDSCRRAKDLKKLLRKE